MKKRMLTAATAIALCVMMISCNKQVIDTTMKYDRAIITLPNGEVVEGKLDSWKDYDDSDQIQAKIDGKTYLVHSANIVLICD